MTPPPPITPIDEEPDDNDSGSDDPSAPLLNNSTRENTSSNRGAGRGADPSRSPSPAVSSRSHDAGARNPFTNHRHQLSSALTHFAASLSVPSRPGSELTVQLHPPPDSPMSPNINPPTPGVRDIHLQALNSGRRSAGASSSTTDSGDPGSATSTDRLLPPSPLGRREPPAYSPLDAYTYADGVQVDLPAEVIAAALEGDSAPPSAVGSSSRSSDRRRSRRR